MDSSRRGETNQRHRLRWLSRVHFASYVGPFFLHLFSSSVDVYSSIMVMRFVSSLGKNSHNMTWCSNNHHCSHARRHLTCLCVFCILCEQHSINILYKKEKIKHCVLLVSNHKGFTWLNLKPLTSENEGIVTQQNIGT